MKELAELKDLMAELLDGEIQYEPEMAVTERGKEIINEIADYTARPRGDGRIHSLLPAATEQTML